MSYHAPLRRLTRRRSCQDKLEGVRIERELIELVRAGEDGEMTVQFTKGQPKISRGILNFRHGELTERQAALALLPRLREKYEEETLLLQ